MSTKSKISLAAAIMLVSASAALAAEGANNVDSFNGKDTYVDEHGVSRTIERDPGPAYESNGFGLTVSPNEKHRTSHKQIRDTQTQH